MDNKEVVDNFEPKAAKKIKLDEDVASVHAKNYKTLHPQAVLNKKYYRPLETVEVFVCEIKDRKDASRLLREINEIYKLEDLKHLKKIKNEDGQLSVIITTVERNAPNNGTTSLKDLFKGTPVDTTRLCEPLVTFVPKYPPLTRQQHNEWSKIWPTSFHENKYISKLINGQLFDQTELQEMESYMTEAIDAALVAKSKKMLPIGAVIVNPKTKEILCKVHDCSTNHPLQHAVMVAIDMIGRLQGGGAWEINCMNDEHLRTFRDKASQPEKPESCLSKISNKGSLKDNDISCGNMACKDVYETVLDNTGTSSSDVAYLCTGYDIYTTREPCAMCSMALLHSRIRRVFYAQPYPSFGGLGSRYRIHCLNDTNHHFEVFSGFLDIECYQKLS